MKIFISYSIIKSTNCIQVLCGLCQRGEKEMCSGVTNNTSELFMLPSSELYKWCLNG